MNLLKCFSPFPSTCVYSRHAYSHAAQLHSITRCTVAVSPPLASGHLISVTVIWKAALLWEQVHSGFIWHRCLVCEAYMCTCTVYTHTATHPYTHMNGVAHKSQLWCQPFNVYTTHKSHFRLTHSHMHTHALTQVSELLRSVQTRLKRSPGSSVWSLVNLIWFRFLTWWIKNDKNVHFNLIYFPSWPWQHLYQPLCSGKMPGISSVCFPSLRQRPKVCAKRAEFSFSGVHRYSEKAWILKECFTQCCAAEYLK